VHLRHLQKEEVLHATGVGEEGDWTMTDVLEGGSDLVLLQDDRDRGSNDFALGEGDGPGAGLAVVAQE
jgi:hypothetical protein